MPIKSSITIEEAVDFLNELRVTDAAAIQSLFSMRTSCNEKMADHPTVQVGTIGTSTYYIVGLIGIINGLFGVDDDGIGRITVDYTDGQIDRFRLTDALMDVEIKKLRIMALHNPFSYNEIKDAYLYCDKNYDEVERAMRQSIRFNLPLPIMGLMTKLNLTHKEE
jgi:hypothetical protein